MNAHTQILLIEDDMAMVEVITAYFRQKDMMVSHCIDAQEALKAIISNKVQPELIVTDLNLPGLSGLSFIRELRAAQNHLPVILVTASTDVDIAVEAIDAGAYDYVVKPIHFPQLLISVQRALKYQSLHNENKNLRDVIDQSKDLLQEGIIGKSEGIRRTLELAKRVANSSATVSITGESGTGKEVFAKAIHQWSDRRDKPFVAINCSAIPENLLESELFGHAKGAFTGAIEKKIGLFEEANGGTIFLDEIGDMDLALQAKILRVLQEKLIKRVGENQSRAIDVRVITATHKDLQAEVQAKRFREDLYFRLNVIPIKIPPLRERREDILPLAEFFLKKFSQINGGKVTGFAKCAKEFLMTQHWRGNVRELENTVERAVVLSSGSEIDVSLFLIFDQLPQRDVKSIAADRNIFIFKHGDEIAPLRDVEQKYVEYVFEKCARVKDTTAKMLGIDRKTLYRKLASEASFQ